MLQYVHLCIAVKNVQIFIYLKMYKLYAMPSAKGIWAFLGFFWVWLG